MKIFAILAVVLLLLLLLSLAYLLFLFKELIALNKQLKMIRSAETNSEVHGNSMNPLLIELYQEMNLFIKSNKMLYQEMKENTEQFDLAVSNITHDLRTPLTVASGYSQYIEKNPEIDDEQKKELQLKITQHLIDVETKLDDLLTYNRIAEKNITLDLEKFSLSNMLEETLFSYFDFFQEKNITLEIELEPKISLISDPEIVKRIIQNILGNILTHGNDEAFISLNETNNAVVITAKNKTNQVITDYDQLFKRFYTEDLSRKKKNAGLGLYIIKELTESLNGNVSLKGNDDSFMLTLTIPHAKNNDVP